MVQIIPAILTSNPLEVKDKIRLIDEHNLVSESPIERVQIDIIDGVYAENKTVFPEVLLGIDTEVTLDFHLMVKEPVNWIERCANAGADRIIAQIEKMSDQVEFVGKVTEAGLKVGLAVDIDTDIKDLDSSVLTNLDVVLLMAVNAGFGGQKFNPSVLEKIKEIDLIRQNDTSPFRICVDGGETVDTIYETHLKGADEVVVGTRIFEGDLTSNIHKYQLAAHDVK